MSDESQELWSRIVEILHEKLQYGFLDQVKNVVHVKIEGNSLELTVSDDEACEFFNSELNQQRLALLCRPVFNLENLTAVKCDAEPLR